MGKAKSRTTRDVLNSRMRNVIELIDIVIKPSSMKTGIGMSTPNIVALRDGSKRVSGFI